MAGGRPAHDPDGTFDPGINQRQADDDIDPPGIGGIEFRRRLADSGGDLSPIFITALDRAEVSEPLAAHARGGAVQAV